MRIKVLGGFGSESGSSNLTAFLVNGCVMLDAGTASSVLSPDEQSAITHVALSHAHFDHIKALPFLADNLAGLKDKPVEVAGAPEVIDPIREHIFNGLIWPDFSKLPKDRPAFKFRKLAPGREVAFGGGLKLRAVRVNHSIPTTGFILREEGKAIVYSGDTKATEEIWEKASRLGRELKAVFVETSFPDRMADLAERTCHLTPKTLDKELRKIKGFDGPVYVYHMKTRYVVEIEHELHALGRNIIAVRDGMEWEI